MSLKRIYLRDFVIVRELELELTSGFTVLTGETGAGKSILIDALQLALGARADAAVVREGAERCEISVAFNCTAPLVAWLEDKGLQIEDDLLLRRTIDVQGKSRAWINGSPATATQLKEIADLLVDIHGQHAWQSLTRPDSVRGLLDAYAGVSLNKLNPCWQAWRTAQKTLDEARSAQDSLQREQERLAWQIGELDKLAPGADEWDELNTQHSRLSNAQSLRDAVEAALNALQDVDDSATSQLGRALSALQAQAHIEPQFAGPLEVLQSALAQAEDAVHSLNGYARHSELEPQRLNELDERLASWVSLARRYKRLPAELPELLANWRQELQKLDAATDLAALERAVSSAQTAYLAEAKIISSARTKAAPALGKAITSAM